MCWALTQRLCGPCQLLVRPGKGHRQDLLGPTARHLGQVILVQAASSCYSVSAASGAGLHGPSGREILGAVVDPE